MNCSGLFLIAPAGRFDANSPPSICICSSRLIVARHGGRSDGCGTGKPEGNTLGAEIKREPFANGASSASPAFWIPKVKDGPRVSGTYVAGLSGTWTTFSENIGAILVKL